MPIRSFATPLLAAAMLSGCSMVDQNLETRIMAANRGNGAARNDTILLNIIRAADSQPLSFVTFSKMSGTQNTDLKLGLPTVTIGRGQTTAQKQVVFGSNSWENSASSSFDAAPLESGDFYKAMSSSVDLGVMQALIRQGFSRELVFNTFIGSIRVTGDQGAVEYRNDPLLDSANCPAVAYGYGDQIEPTAGEGVRIGSFAAAQAEYGPGENAGRCEFRHFEFLLQAALKWGLNIESVEEVKETPKPQTPTVRSTSPRAPRLVIENILTAPPTGDKGPAEAKKFRFCFDLAYVDRNASRDELALLRQPDLQPYLCGAMASAGSPKPTELRVRFGMDRAPAFAFDVRPRSGLAVFRYLGRVYRSGAHGPQLYWSDSKSDFDEVERRTDGMALVDIKQADRAYGDLCFAKVAYFGRFYCVPDRGTTATKQMFSLVAQLMALSTTASALPTTLDVRLQ